MRRRAFVRTVTAAWSATVFGAAGWLMGTRSMTMGGQPPPVAPPDNVGYYSRACPGGQADCTWFCAFNCYCQNALRCPQGEQCIRVTFEWTGCGDQNCLAGWCQVQSYPSPCGSCSSSPCSGACPP